MDNPTRLTMCFVLKVNPHVFKSTLSRFGCAGRRSLPASLEGEGRVKDAVIWNVTPWCRGFFFKNCKYYTYPLNVKGTFERSLKKLQLRKVELVVSKTTKRGNRNAVYRNNSGNNASHMLWMFYTAVVFQKSCLHKTFCPKHFCFSNQSKPCWIWLFV